MLRLAKLRDAEYVLEAVAGGLEDYYLGQGEAPGVWAGRLAEQLGVSGVVEAEGLRALIDGRDPTTGTGLGRGLDPKRVVRAFDATFSPPKSVSLLWAFGTPELASAVSIAHVEAVAAALAFYEERTAVARQQVDGVRRRVCTSGFAAATFVHRTSREGDPQLHTHCVIPNLVCRPDGSWVALDAGALYHWAKAAGCIYQEELRCRLTTRLGVSWSPDRNGTRELLGFSEEQLAVFSKRTHQIEEHLAGWGIKPTDPKSRMRADEAASLATRRPKDRSLTPERLRKRWVAEAAEVGLPRGRALEDHVRRAAVGQWREMVPEDVERLMAQLVDPEVGLCAHDSRFSEAQVIAAVAAYCGGDLSSAQIQAVARGFLDSDSVIRLMDRDPSGRTPPRYSTVAHRQLEDRVLESLDEVVARAAVPIEPTAVEAALGQHRRLGPDQADAVRTLCGAGPAIRALIAPAGYGKTTTLRAAAEAACAEGRVLVALATTNQAVAELRQAGLAAQTVARFGLDGAALPDEAVVVVDELSQLPTIEAEVVLGAVAGCARAQLWLVGDPLQAQPVRAGGLGPLVAQLAEAGRIPAAELTVNRRQTDPTERAALAAYREGEVGASQQLREGAGLEHHAANAEAATAAMAAAVVEAIGTHGPERVAALAVSHTECEDLADSIRVRLAQRGLISGPALRGPGWAGVRRYQAGDRVLVHAHLDLDGGRLVNGATATVVSISRSAMAVRPDGGDGTVIIPAPLVAGRGPDGRPHLSHAWARTIDGVQGATFAQVHLLGTAALDRYRCYVGQSRSIAPTHTWNTRGPDPADHGGHLVRAGRTPAEEVRAAMARAPTKTFAAADDPYHIGRRLRAEQDGHRAALAQRPPDLSRQVAEARAALAEAQCRTAEDRERARHWQAQLAASGGARRLLPSGRRQGQQAAGRAADFGARLKKHDRLVVELRARLGDLEGQDAVRRSFDETQGWRAGRITQIDRQLGQHWAKAVVAAARTGEPYAYGSERLDRAIAMLSRSLDALSRRANYGRAQADHGLGQTERDLAMLERAVVVQRSKSLLLTPARRVDNDQRSGGATITPTTGVDISAEDAEATVPSSAAM